MPRHPLFLKIGRKIMFTAIVAALTFGVFFVASYAFAQDTDCDALTEQTGCEASVDCRWDGAICATAPAEQPTKNQVVQVKPVNSQVTPNWEPNALSTFGLKFLVRAKEALSWSLLIDNSSFDNPAIRTSYNKVLTIVNSLFILGLLAIAAMWMFSIIIPRRYLRQVVLVYGAAVILINFAFPLNSLLIDSTNLLQKTLLAKDNGAVAILDIVQTPAYDEAIAYEDTSKDLHSAAKKDISFVAPVGQQEVAVGKVKSETPRQITGQMTGAGGGNIVLDIPPNEQSLSLSQTIKLSEDKNFKAYNEQSVFGFLMVLLTGIAYFTLALIFLLRVIILWALLILSPALLILAVFRTTRGWFANWLSLYGRWLLIGPLTALGIAIVVNIWQSIGLPVQSAYTGTDFKFAQDFTNISFRLPGSTEPNTLSTTAQMMEYLVFLFMLYLPIFFAFALTRQKVWQSAVTVVAERAKEARRPQAPTVTVEQKEGAVKEAAPGAGGMMQMLKGFIGTQLTKVTEATMPTGLRAIAPALMPIPTASSFLPEQLALTGLRGLMGLMGENPESRHSREQVIEKLALPDKISDLNERKNANAVRQEIENRSLRGDPEASVLMQQIRDKTQDMQGAGVMAERAAQGVTEVEKPAPVPAVTSGVQVTATPSETAVTGIPVYHVTEEKIVHEKEEKTAATAAEIKTPSPKPEKAEEKKSEKKEEEKKKEEGEEKEEAGEKETEEKAESKPENKTTDE